MKYCLFVVSSLLAFESSHSWQTQVPTTRARAHQCRRRPLTQLEAGLDPELLPALTASTALFVGAAGALFYNRVIAKERKEIGAAESTKGLILDTEAVKMEENATELEAEISKVIKEEKSKETKVEKAETKPPSTEVTSTATGVADRAGTGKPVSTVVADKRSIKMEAADGGTATSLNETPSKSKEEKPAVAVEASSTATDLKSPTEATSPLPPKANGKGVSTVGEPKISPTAEERALESLSRDKNSEPSFISFLETSQVINKETDDEKEDTTIPPSFNKTVASVKPKPKKPEIKVAMNPSSTSANAAYKAESLKKAATAQKEENSSSTASSAKKETVRNAWLPSKRGVNDSSKSTAIPVKETAATVSAPSVQGKSATNHQTKDTVKTSDATPEAKDTTAATKSPSSKETVVSSVSATTSKAATTVATPPASSIKNEDNSSKPKIRLNIKETPKENGSSQSTKDTVKSLSTPSDINRGSPSKPPIPETKTTVTTAPLPAAATTADTENEPDISLKSILAPESQDFDEDIAFDSLQQYIQNKARDMTLKRMGKKAGFDVLQPTAKEKSRKVEPKKIKRETVDDKLPVFMAPKVDDPYAKTNVKDTADGDHAVDDDDQVTTKVSSDSGSSEEQIAKSLKKSRNRSLTKKAQKSVLLVAVVTGVVFVGKRLASVVLGRGML